MPKLKKPTDEQLLEAITSLYRDVDSDYVHSHNMAAVWCNKSHAASLRYRNDARKRAAPIIKWIQWQCAQADLSWSVESVHLIDHSKKPPQVAPYIVLHFSDKKTEHAIRIELKLYKPTQVCDIKIRVSQVFGMFEKELA